LVVAWSSVTQSVLPSVTRPLGDVLAASREKLEVG
jgi:hypothetical protein